MKSSMKLKETGSLVNWLMGNNLTIPEVGKGATILSWTDRHAYEVMSVSEDKTKVVIQQHLPERIDKNGMSDSQQYKYEKLNGYDEEIIWRNGAWRRIVEQIIYLDETLKKYPTFEDRNQFYDKNGYLKLIKGITRIKRSYPKVNIIWGVKKEYFDYSF